MSLLLAEICKMSSTVWLPLASLGHSSEISKMSSTYGEDGELLKFKYGAELNVSYKFAVNERH